MEVMKYKIRPILISTLAGFILPYLFAVTMGSGRINTHEGTGIQVPHFKNSSEQHDFFIKNSRPMTLPERFEYAGHIINNSRLKYLLSSLSLSLFIFFSIMKKYRNRD